MREVESYSAMENFFKVRADKQAHIIDAGFAVFGKQGYRKASMADIAARAGTTKGMITYYFGSKKTLYLHLLEVIQSSLGKALKSRLTPDVTDFFERCRILMEINVTAIKQHPAAIAFATSVYYEKDPEVEEYIQKIIFDDNDRIYRMLLDGVDYTKFRPGFDPQLLCKFATWAAGGLNEELYDPARAEKVDCLVDEFYRGLDLIREAFYR